MAKTIGLEKWRRRTWVVSKGDILSSQKAGTIEETLFWGHGGGERRVGQWDLISVPRARKIHQSLLTTPISALQCLWACTGILGQYDPPDLILTNGPGTGVIVVLASLIFRFFDFSDKGAGRTRVAYVESLARVKKLSLSGRLLVRVADRFLVQWEELDGQGEYVGPVVLDAVRRQAEASVEEDEEPRGERLRIEM